MTTQVSQSNATQKHIDDYPISLLCWKCGTSVGPIMLGSSPVSTTRSCSNCDSITPSTNNVWQTLSSQRTEYFERFISDYAFIRSAEGRGSTDSEYYLALPYQDLSRKNTPQWKIRARTFRYIQEHILTPLANLQSKPLRILDLGAGNGWMSYRLALMGHLPIAVDILTNNSDGLGAAVHFNKNLGTPFPCVQSEMDHLPFPSSSFDLTVFNASFHYSENYERTLGEALRCTRSGGAVLIADTPWYENEESGRRMVEEKHITFANRYGLPSDSIGSMEYVTPERLQKLQARLSIKWDIYSPFYGVGWALRPLRAKLFNRRPPSQFRIYAAWVA